MNSSALKRVKPMVLTRRNEMSLYREAKAGLRSLLQQIVPVSLGFLVMLLVTGGKPPAWVVGFSFVSGTLFVAWSEKKRLVAQEDTTSSQNFVNQEQSELIKESEDPVVLGNSIRARVSEKHHQFVQDLIMNLQALAIVLEQRGYLASCYTAGGQMTSASFMVSLGQNHLIRFLVSDYGITWTEMRDDRELMKLEGAEAISQLQELAELVRFKPKVADDLDELDRVFATLSQLSQEVS